MRHLLRSAFTSCSVAIIALLALSPGCIRTRTDLGVRSMVVDTSMQPSLPVRAYFPTDQNTCDVYLSDIPASRLADLADPLADVAGNIIHMHIFLIPEAGKTPIDASACNMTVRQVILTASDGAAPGPHSIKSMGLYAGGGFCLPSAEPGDLSFDGSLFEATLRLARATPGFADRLGAAKMSGSFAAPRNDDLAKAISARMQSLYRSMSEVRKPIDE